MNTFHQQHENKPNLESMMNKFLRVQEEQKEAIMNLTSQVASQFASQASQISQLFTHGKMLENQIASQASTSNFRQSSKLPSQPQKSKRASECNNTSKWKTTT